MILINWLYSQFPYITETMLLSVEPEKLPEEGERIFGTLTEEEKKLFFLSQNTNDALLKLFLAHTLQHVSPFSKLTEEDCKEHRLLCIDIIRNNDLFRLLFWKAVELRIPETASINTKICHGWQIVEADEKDQGKDEENVSGGREKILSSRAHSFSFGVFPENFCN